MIGAIAGDIIGSIHEGAGTKTKQFPLFGPHNRCWGNGSAMRVSPVGFAYDRLDDVMHHAGRTAAVTHNHPEGIRGAQATAVAIYLSRTGSDKQAIRQHLVDLFGYDLSTPLNAIRENYGFGESRALHAISPRNSLLYARR